MEKIDKKKLLKRINDAEANFMADHIEEISSEIENPFIDGVLSALFCIKEMIREM